MFELKSFYTCDNLLRQLALWRADDRCRPVLLTPYVQSEDLEKQKKWAERITSSESEFFFYIFDNNVLVGYCALIKVKMVPSNAELSILIDPDKARRGYGTKAIRWLLGVAFEELGLNCVYSEVYANTERHKFFEKFFTFDGTIRARKFWKGKFYDSRMYSILKNEFFLDKL